MEFNGTDKRYNQFSEHLKNKFGAKVYKITLDAGFSCPNRDGTISKEGCIFCDDGGSFSQAHSNRLSIEEQVNTGAETLKKRFKAQKFMSYFQAFSNTTFLFLSASHIIYIYDINNKYFDLVFAKDSARIGLGPKQRSIYVVCAFFIILKIRMNFK